MIPLIEVFKIIGIFYFLYLILKNFNFFNDDTTYSEHKKFGQKNNSPVVMGGFF